MNLFWDTFQSLATILIMIWINYLTQSIKFKNINKNRANFHYRFIQIWNIISKMKIANFMIKIIKMIKMINMIKMMMMKIKKVIQKVTKVNKLRKELLKNFNQLGLNNNQQLHFSQICCKNKIISQMFGSNQKII